jgi:hypothetical protein
MRVSYRGIYNGASQDQDTPITVQFRLFIERQEGEAFVLWLSGAGEWRRNHERTHDDGSDCVIEMMMEG